MIDTYTVAEHLYTVYCQSVGGKAFNGDPLPSWGEFVTDPTKEKQSKAWLDTADAAIDLLSS
jgi:hypothetical protein